MMSAKRSILFCLWFVAPFLVGSSVYGGDKEIQTQDQPDPWLSGDASMEMVSRYVQAGNESAYSSPVFNSNFELEAFYFSLGLAEHIALQNAYKETDVYLDYTRPLGPLNISLGYVYAYMVNSPNKSLHDFYGGISLPFAKYYTVALNGEADVTQTVGTFTELITTAKYPVIKDKILFSPYVGVGYSYGFSTGTTVGATGSVERFGINTPFTLSKNWELNFQVETVFSQQLNGLVWYGARVTYNF